MEKASSAPARRGPNVWLAGTALWLAWLTVTAVIFLATAAACKAAAWRARRAGLR